MVCHRSFSRWMPGSSYDRPPSVLKGLDELALPGHGGDGYGRDLTARKLYPNPSTNRPPDSTRERPDLASEATVNHCFGVFSLPRAPRTISSLQINRVFVYGKADQAEWCVPTVLDGAAECHTIWGSHRISQLRNPPEIRSPRRDMMAPEPRRVIQQVLFDPRRERENWR